MGLFLDGLDEMTLSTGNPTSNDEVFICECDVKDYTTQQGCPSVAI